ncbi:MAG TPA: hypothetical protein VMF66_00290 [Candidatus Acidoferrum sp.]|nr:hypothetical protein [Candidatus Acidoferrum sp.]
MDATPEDNHSLWYKRPEWWLVVAAFATMGVIAWQSIETRRAATATRDSVAEIKQQAGLMKRQTKSIHHQAVQVRRQTKILAESADAARKSADAALLNAQTTINTERALVEISITAPSKQIDAETGEECIDYGEEFRYGISIINHGRTVARILSYEVRCGCFAGDFSKDSFTDSFPSTRHMVLGIRKPAVLANIDIGELLTDWPSILNKTKIGMLRVDVHYEDIIQGHAHRTTVIYRYSPEAEGPIRLPQFNEYT